MADKITPKDKASISSSPDFESIERIMIDSESWLSIKEISHIGELSQSKCKVILNLLIESNIIGAKHVTNLRSPDGVTLYAKISIVAAEIQRRESTAEFKHAISRFQLKTAHASGSYIASENMNQSLAMLSRRVN